MGETSKYLQLTNCNYNKNFIDYLLLKAITYKRAMNINAK